MNLVGRLMIPRAYYIVYLVWAAVNSFSRKKSKKKYRERVQTYKKVCEAEAVRHLRSLGYHRDPNRSRPCKKGRKNLGETRPDQLHTSLFCAIIKCECYVTKKKGWGWQIIQDRNIS